LQPQSPKVGQFSSIEASQQVLFEALPPVLVLQLERFLYDAAADGMTKISKPIRFPPELEFPLGTIFFFRFYRATQAENPSRLGWSRNHGAHSREVFGASALQALCGA
jgi:hypothetical protein